MNTPDSILRTHYFNPDAIRVLSGGRINATYLVEANNSQWVLQRLSHDVFVEPAPVIERAGRVLDLLHQLQPDWAPRIRRTRSGEWSAQDASGRHWRLLHYKAHVKTPAVDRIEIVEAIGYAFGHNQNLLSQLDLGTLPGLIPGYLDLAHHLQKLIAMDESHSLIPLLVSRGETLVRRFENGTDLIHGDAKLANLLFDGQGQVCGVVDWDTLMTGHWALDLGDLARSLLGHSPLPAEVIWPSLTAAFLKGANQSADPELILDAARYVTLLLGVRYLVEHLSGGHYFKEVEPGDNLIQAQRQMAVLGQLDQLNPE